MKRTGTQPKKRKERGSLHSYTTYMAQVLFDNNEEQKSEEGKSLLDKAAGVFSSINRFMKSM